MITNAADADATSAAVNNVVVHVALSIVEPPPVTPWSIRLSPVVLTVSSMSMKPPRRSTASELSFGTPALDLAILSLAIVPQIALNFQTWDGAMQLNRARFAINK